MQSGGNNDSWSYDVTSNYLAGFWQNLGDSKNSGGEYSNSTYEGSSFYTSTFSDNDSLFSISGTTMENGYDSSNRNYRVDSNLIGNVWETTGSGSDGGSHGEFLSYIGDGSFRTKVGDAHAVGDPDYTGTASQNGSNDSDSVWNSDWTLQNGIWLRSGGSGSDHVIDSFYIDFDGKATTDEVYTKDEVHFSTSTDRTVEGNRSGSSDVTLYFGVFNGDWVTSGGNGTGDGSSFLKTTYKTGGTYSYKTGDANNGQEGNGNLSKENNHGDHTSTSDSEYEFLWNNGWITIGTTEYTETDNSYFKSTGEGKFWNNSGSEASHNYTKMSGTFTEERNTNSQFDAEWKEGHNADGTNIFLSGEVKKNTFHDDSKVTRNGDGSFGTKTEVFEDGQFRYKTEISGISTLENTATTKYDSSVTEKVIDHQWKLDSGSYTDEVSNKGTFTPNGNGSIVYYLGGESVTRTVTIEDEDKPDTKTTWEGKVEGTTGNKIWKETGTAEDNGTGKNNYTETLDETPYERIIVGGMVSGTLLKSISHENSYGNEKVKYEFVNNTWQVISGSRWSEGKIEDNDEYKGNGNYSFTTDHGIHLAGTIDESGKYTLITEGGRIVETFNKATKQWDETTKEGTITYTEDIKYSDKSTGTYEVSGGTGTITQRDSSDTYFYEAKEHLNTGTINYTQTVTNSSDYEAEQITDSDNGLSGKRKQWTKEHLSGTETIHWTWDILDGLYYEDGTYTGKIDDDSGTSFVIQKDNNLYDRYSYESSIIVKNGSITETLDVETLNILIENGELDDPYDTSGFWDTTGGSVTAKSKLLIDWSKSGNNNKDIKTVAGHEFEGTSGWSESYFVDRQLRVTENFAAGENEDSVTGNGTEIIKHYRSDSFDGDEQTYEYYGSTGTRNGSSLSHLNRDMNFDYELVDEESWHITGTGKIDGSSNWSFTDNASGTLESGNQTGSISSSKTDKNKDSWGVNYDYDNLDGGWKASSVESGSGSGEYKINNKNNLSGDYERPFHSMVISGEQGSKNETDWNETWNISYKIVNGQLVRETDGKIVETYEASSWHSGDGSDSFSSDVTIAITDGTRTDHYEWNASISEGNKNSFKEVVTTNWSHKADENGNLQFDASAVAELTTKADGNYSYHYDTKTSVNIDRDYECSDKYGTSYYGYIHSDSEHSTTIDVSENYHSDLKETWKFEYGDAAFSLYSREGTMSGSGISEQRDFTQDTSESHTVIPDWIVEVVCPMGISEVIIGDSFSLSEKETLIHADYNSQANYDGSLPFLNIITGFSTTRCKYQIDTDSNPPHECVGCGSCVNSNPYEGSILSEHVLQEKTTTNFSYEDAVYSIGFGRGYVNVYNQVWYNQFSGNGARSNYRNYLTNAHGTGLGGYGNNIDPKTDKIAAGELTVAKPGTSLGNKPADPGDEIPEPILPTMPDSNGISPPIPDQSAWWAGTKAAGWSLMTGVANLVKGGYNMGKEMAFTVVDIGAVSVDTVATLAGRPIGWEEWSSQGKNYKNSTGLDIATNAARSGLAGGTLGVSEIVIGLINYAQDGDADTFQQHIGGVVTGNLAAAGIAKITGINPKFDFKKGKPSLHGGYVNENRQWYQEVIFDGNKSTGRPLPMTLKERMTLEYVKSNPSVGTPIKTV